MTTWLDGNNIMGGADRSGPVDDRERFLEELLTYRLPRPTWVVFDGPPPLQNPFPKVNRGPLRVLYAGKRSADSAILQRVRPGDKVVTGDRELMAGCRARGCRIISPQAFLGGLQSKGGKASEKPAAVSGREVEEWLQIFGDET